MKKLLMSTTIILLTICIMVPFSVRTTKAAGNIVYATGGTFDEGEYNVYTAQASSGSYLQFYAFDKYYSFDQYHSACIIKIDLDDVYSGDITLNFSSNYTMFPLWWVETEQGSCGIDGINKQIILHVKDVQSLTVYLCSTNTSSNGIQPTSVTSNLATTSVYNDLLTYNIPLDRIGAFNFFLNMGDQIYYNSHTSNPYINIYSSKNSATWCIDGVTIILSYWRLRDGNNFSLSHDFNVTNVSGSSYSVERISSTDSYALQGGNILITYKITYTGTSGWLRFTPVLDQYVYPVYFGRSTDYISEETAAYIGLPIGDPETSQDINNTSDDLSDISGQINVITDQIDIDFNNNINNIDLDDHDFFTGLTNTTNYFKVYVQDFYNNIGDVKALLIVPVIVTIMMLIAGWMF